MSYVRSCLDVGDLHGVRDAIVDIEVAKGKIEVLEKKDST